MKKRLVIVSVSRYGTDTHIQIKNEERSRKFDRILEIAKDLPHKFKLWETVESFERDIESLGSVAFDPDNYDLYILLISQEQLTQYKQLNSK